ncbi:LTA synthase family protein [Vallitalea okinawensis]|uniref:LTA synthase family protein n=1 Tax=Vallitalea okinawensis TaxID=2078660 RepID=UPI0014783ED6|nr:LTA synthase family protein [Vallitalea okinawensis]
MIVIIGIVLSSFLVLRIRTYKFKLYIRISGVIITVLCVIMLNQTVYSDKQLYSSLYIKGTDCFQVDHYNSKGFIYCFWYFINSNKIEKPEGYSLDKAETLLKDYNDIENKANTSEINVILIMGEAFSDICNNKNLSFEGYTYPLMNFEKLKQDSLSGYIITPNFGGGTANTEFDVLTGLCTKYINENASSFWYIRKPIDSLVNTFKKNGYKTIAIHPGYSWFYNRQNVYKHLGFDEFIHSAYFNQDAVKGNYISEKVTIDKVLDTFREHQVNSHSPIFIHCVTLQNHYAYKNKYNGITQNFSTDKLLTEEEINMISNYFEGLKDADLELRRLTDNLEISNEPVVIMYFGDHLPSFGGGVELYQKLGYPMKTYGTIEERLNMNKVPFLIWQNKACKEIFNLQANADNIDLFNGAVINANYLGGLLLELMEFENLSPVFEYSNKLCNELPIMTPNNHFKTSLGYTDSLSKELEEKLVEYKTMQYYLLTE